MGDFGGAFIGLMMAVVMAFVGVTVVLALYHAFLPYDGQYAWEIAATAISALVGAVVAAGIALKGAAGG